jgi:pyruvate/2-oxoglutarate dehydrogenase complex dihydrolipoamide acyltransferase (E2) component
MNFEVELPELGGDGGDRATVAEWRFDEGEFVEKGDVLMEVSTESGTVEVHSPYAGYLIERIVDEDEIVRVGEPIAMIENNEDESLGDEDEE